jgi:hypothetical protein
MNANFNLSGSKRNHWECQEGYSDHYVILKQVETKEPDEEGWMNILANELMNNPVLFKNLKSYYDLHNPETSC